MYDRPFLMAPRLSNPQFSRMCSTLWSWVPCDECDDFCSCNKCTSRIARLTPFLQHYNEVISVACYHLQAYSAQVQTIHDLVFSTIVLLKRSAKNTKTETRRQLRSDVFKDLQVDDIAGDVILRAATEIMTMINCSSREVSMFLLEDGFEQTLWRDDVTLVDFVETVLPRRNDKNVHDIQDAYCGLSSGRMTARKLIKHAKIVLRPTSDICAHLRYDHASNSLEIFHHTTFLKEQLRATKGMTLDTAAGLQRGTLPRQLLLEVLDSIQSILFPLKKDDRSETLLRAFIKKHSLDPDCLHFDRAEIREEHETAPTYEYFASRIMDLHEVALNPRPQRRFEKWLERKSGSRYVMLATVSGILFAIILGMCALAVSIFQTYITYQAWKHPVPVAG